MEKLLHKVNSLPDVKGDPLPLAQLFLARGLYYAALNVSASQQAALRTIAEDIEARPLGARARGRLRSLLPGEPSLGRLRTALRPRRPFRRRG